MKRVVLVVMVCAAAVTGTVWAGGEREKVSPEPAAEGFKAVELENSEVSWKIDGENVTFRLSAPTTGWVAVGFKPSKFMKDADIIIGYIENGEVSISDQFGTSSFVHQADVDIGGTDDIISASGSESGGRTEIEFVLPLDSGDRYDQPLAEGENMVLILAYGRNGTDDFTAKHATRASVEIPF